MMHDSNYAAPAMMSFSHQMHLDLGGVALTAYLGQQHKHQTMHQMVFVQY